MIEYMVKPNLVDKFHESGFVFKEPRPQSIIRDEKNKIIAEVDITLENDEKVMLVEVKSKPSIKDIKDHVERADLHGDKRKYLGAVAGMIIPDNERNFILKNGFYVIEPSGETFTTTPPEGSLREW
jgi:predicted AAA+ superfamily ATPase